MNNFEMAWKPMLRLGFSISFYILSIAYLFVFLRSRRLRRVANPRNLPYPPGPKPLPVIGNLFDLARENESATYLKMAHKYGMHPSLNQYSLRPLNGPPVGHLVFLSVLGKNVLFVNSFQTANELFEKRGSNYSDRSSSPMINDLYVITFVHHESV